MEISELYDVFLRSSGVTTDTRQIREGKLFFALKGERFNGNEFAEEAIKNGALYAIIDEEKYQKGEHYILVNNVLKTLQKLANYHRNQLEIPVIAITGSNGKTTTKELIGAVLESHYRTYFTQGNFNNHLGVPLTLLNISKDTEIAVIEMGANHVGEIDELCQIANPTHGLITNIGKAHIEGFGSLEGVKKAKSELYRFLAQKNGFVFINKDELYLEKLAEDCKYKVFYKEDNVFDHPYIYQVESIDNFPFVSVAFASRKNERIIVKTNIVGQYNFNNILTAIAIGKYFKVPSIKIKQVLEAYTPSNNRSQVIEKEDNSYILDAYNANPSSMKAALENFNQLRAKKKVVILGDMLELGKESANEHQLIFDLAKSFQFSKIITVGNLFDKIPNNNFHFENVNDLKNWLSKEKFENTYFLIKGSRGIQLEKLFQD